MRRYYVLAGLATLLAYRRLAARRSLRGRRVLITGGSRGLGLLLAREFLRRGCSVAICARDPDELAAARGALGGRVAIAACDVAEREQVVAAIEMLRERLGGIDVLVNNAGEIDVGPVEAMRAEDFAHALDVMFWGVLHPTLAVLPDMQARRDGHIVNITSIGGRVSVPHLLPYCCAKFAAVGLSEGLHAELADAGVRVTTVVPGLMRTGSHVQARFRADAEAEFRWFGLGATLPLVSMDAERAARRIVHAVERGSSDVVLSPPAKLAGAVHGLFPGTTARLLGWVDRLVLPPPAARSATPVRGAALSALQPVWFQRLTRLGRAAARRFQTPGPGLGAGPRRGGAASSAAAPR